MGSLALALPFIFLMMVFVIKPIPTIIIMCISQILYLTSINMITRDLYKENKELKAKLNSK
jgi:hypothetical protein